MHLRTFGLVSLLICRLAWAEAPPVLELQPGAVGAVYLVSSDKDSATVDVVFPASAVKNPGGGWVERGEGATKGPVLVRGVVALFDAKGRLVELPSSNGLKMTFWCENDGGQQYRPALRMKVAVAKLARPLVGVEALQKLAAFAVVTPAGKTVKLAPVALRDAAPLTGDLDGDGKPEAAIVTAPDDAKNCDGKPANNLTLTLHTAEGDSPLRCCGP
jgi:hypothetical protein